MNIKELKEKLNQMDEGYEHMFKYPTNLPPEQINKILDNLGCSHGIHEDWNGWELDWSMTFELNDNTFEAWGSGYSGSMCFQKTKH